VAGKAYKEANFLVRLLRLHHQKIKTSAIYQKIILFHPMLIIFILPLTNTIFGTELKKDPDVKIPLW